MTKKENKTIKSLAVCLMALLFSVISVANAYSRPMASSTGSLDEGRAASKTPGWRYQTKITRQAIFHIVTVAPSADWQVVVGAADSSSDQVALLDDFARGSRAAVAINAGFFDPQNRQTTSFITMPSGLVLDPKANARLTENPGLVAYLPAIFERPEWRRYTCGPQSGAWADHQARYAIVSHHSDPVPAGCMLKDSVGAGPELLLNQAVPSSTALKTLFQEAAFTDYQNTRLVRDPVGVYQANARSAVGLKPDGTVLLIMVEQTAGSRRHSRARHTGGGGRPGVSLPELAQLLHQLGASQAMALDGGSSSSLYVDGQTFYGKRDRDGQPVQRPVKSVLMVVPVSAFK